MAETLAWSTITVTGPDATTFLDGQLSQDLQGGIAAWSLVLDPAGTVVSTVWARPVDDGWELLVPRALAEEVEARLARFRIRVQCDLALAEGASDPPLTTEDDLYESGLPWDVELARHLAPHSYGEHFVATTISFTKGCFTGQELVGRMDARGATMPWRFVRASGPSRAVIDEVLRSAGPEGPQGVTRARTVADRVEALGFAHRTLLAREPDSDVALEAL